MMRPMHTRDLFNLDGAVSIVTGGGRGIGRQMATALAELGSAVVVCGRKLDVVEEAAAALRELGVETLGLRCDVRSEEDVDAVVAATRERFGRVDVLVNNAGTVWAGSPEDASLDGWRRVVDVNLTGTYLFCRAAGRVMIEQREGRIVNISSAAAFKGAPPEVMNTISYQATKGAVIAFTRDLAVKWARHGIRVNAIAPGWFPSDMTSYTLEHHGDVLLARTPLGRFGGPDDLKGAIAYLTTAASAWVTGTTLLVDGGETAL
jgi:NAD(P)-dependent dehydrogenase (short-subunit alcohol dehydrogenase family)